MNSTLPFPPVVILRIPPPAYENHDNDGTHFIFGDGTEIVQILFLSAVPRIGPILCCFNKVPESTNLKRPEDSTGLQFCSWFIAIGSVVTLWLVHPFR